jgi:hypothetical protein
VNVSLRFCLLLMLNTEDRCLPEDIASLSVASLISDYDVLFYFSPCFSIVFALVCCVKLTNPNIQAYNFALRFYMGGKLGL